MPDEGNLKTLATMLSVQSALPDYCHQWWPWQFLEMPLKRDHGITTASQAMEVYVRHSASSVWQSAGYSR